MSAYRGVRIADFTQGVAGPMACMLLGDFEAEVVKVEPPGGDRLRDHPGYPAWNRNKTVVALDLADPADLARARELARAADVAVFDHAPGELEALGLDAASLRDGADHLVHVWMPPYGTRGRWSGLPARHSLLAAVSGIAFRQGAYGDSPVHLILPLGWYGQAVMAAGAIGAALYERGVSGQGQAVTVSGLHGVSEVGGVVMVLDQPRLPRGAPQGASPSYRLPPVSGHQHDSGLKIGQAVRHSRFGDGVVLALEGSGNDSRAQVNFKREGPKWLALSVAKLETIDP